MNFTDIEQARDLLRKFLSPTRLVRAPSLSSASGADVYLKLEIEHPTGSFKVRGALNALSRRSQKGGLAGVITSSTGNHGAAVAYAAQKFGVPATVFLPENPNPVKRACIAGFGAEIVEVGRDMEEAREHAARLAPRRGWLILEDVRDLDIAAGAATIACEILEQVPKADVFIVPVGDSNLIRGVAFAAKRLKPAVRIIGVQAERAPAYYRSWKEHRPISTDSAGTIADGLASRIADPENVREIQTLVDEMRLVSEEEMLRAIYRLLLDEHVVAEPAGAASTAALLALGRVLAGTTAVLLLTGANISPDTLRRAILMN